MRLIAVVLNLKEFCFQRSCYPGCTSTWFPVVHD